MADLILLTGGGHARVVAETATLLGRTIAGLLDDNPAPPLASDQCPRLGPLSDHAALAGHDWILATGNLSLRRAALRDLARQPNAATLAHPRAILSPTASIAPGTWIGPGAILHTGASVQAHAIVNSGAILEHDARVGENSHIAPGAVLGGAVHIGHDTLVGLGSRILPGLRIGNGCVIGAGSVVTRDVPDGAMVVGAPARPI